MTTRGGDAGAAAGTLADVLDRLDGVRRSGRGWTARCPAHKDRSPSLSVAEGDGGRLLLYCFGGCSYEEITAALGMATDHSLPAVGKDCSFGPGRATDAPWRQALTLARRQAWARPGVLLMYGMSDIIRMRRQRADRLRREATRAGDTTYGWRLAATAADLDRSADTLEAMLDGMWPC